MTRKEYMDELRAGVTNYALTVKQAIEAAYKHADETNPNGWHPASEKPAFPKDEDEIWVYCLVYGKGTDGKVLVPMCVKYTKLLMLGWELSENIIVKWWCYPPKEERERSNV